MVTANELRRLLSYDPETGVFTWRVSKQGPGAKSGKVAGNKDPRGYVIIKISQRKITAHRLAWLYMTGSLPAGQIDHANGVCSDNRWSNLRLATPAQNLQNRRSHKNNKSGLKGVGFCKKSNKWHARICINKQQMHLGMFASPEEAHAAYCTAAKQYFGQFARAS
jgi:hypothetical protein